MRVLKTAAKAFRILWVVCFYLIARLAPRFGSRILAASLHSPCEDTRQTAYIALVKLGKPVVPSLFDLATESDRPEPLIRVLGDIGDKALVPELESLARKAPHELEEAVRLAIESIRLRTDDDQESAPSDY